MYDVQLSSLFLQVGRYESTSHSPAYYSRYVSNHQDQQVVSGHPLLLCMCGQNCAVSFKGAWWYSTCHPSKINRQYHGECNNYCYWCEPASFLGRILHSDVSPNHLICKYTFMMYDAMFQLSSLFLVLVQM